jgi:hypothetical protein
MSGPNSKDHGLDDEVEDVGGVQPHETELLGRLLGREGLGAASRLGSRRTARSGRRGTLGTRGPLRTPRRACCVVSVRGLTETTMHEAERGGSRLRAHSAAGHPSAMTRLAHTFLRGGHSGVASPP